MQSDEVGITLQNNSIFLGPSSNNETTQPLVLGNNLEFFLSNLLQALSNFCTAISDAKATPEGITLTSISVGSEALQKGISLVSKDLETDKLLSKTTFTL